MVLVDFRHYFHQLPVSDGLSRLFGLCLNTGKNTSKWFRWICVPMGWSWAPYIAQSIGWYVVMRNQKCFRAINRGDVFEEPPMFLETEKGGVVFLYYDNVHGYFTDKSEAEEFLSQLRVNMSSSNLNIRSKYEHLFTPSPSGSEEDRLDALGVEYAMDGEEDGSFTLRWRPSQAKVSKLDSNAVKNAFTPRQFARIAGRCLYRRLLLPHMPADNGDLIHVISMAGSHRKNGVNMWDDKEFRDFLLQDDKRRGRESIEALQAAWDETLANPWISVPHQMEETQFIVSDACSVTYGHVRFEAQKTPGRMTKVRRFACSCKYPDQINPMHIYIKEIFAACRALKEAAESAKREQVKRELVIGIDNTAARYAIERRASVNDVAHRVIVATMKEVESANCTVTALPVPGHYIAADWPSRGHRIRPGELQRKASPKGKDFKEEFDPFQETWNILLMGLEGKRLSIDPEDIDADYLRHAPRDEEAEEMELGDRLLEAVEYDSEEYEVEDDSEDETPGCKRSRKE